MYRIGIDDLTKGTSETLLDMFVREIEHYGATMREYEEMIANRPAYDYVSSAFIFDSSIGGEALWHEVNDNWLNIIKKVSNE